ncbi:hypothetical protein BT69DRAFT_1275867 [Atractiella rhizophila]|nr:hypothetical protein BT69DRAFT_1275867 [Atractiella rhizophila]
MKQKSGMNQNGSKKSGSGLVRGKGKKKAVELAENKRFKVSAFLRRVSGFQMDHH